MTSPERALRAAGWRPLPGTGTGRFTWSPRTRVLEWDEACAALFDAAVDDDPLVSSGATCTPTTSRRSRT